MGFELNQKVRELQPYPPITGDYEVRLDANESFLAPYDGLKDQIMQQLNEVLLNRYPDPYAQKVCDLFAQFYGINPAFVTAGNGSDELISVLVNTFMQKGDTALVLAPDFSMYAFYLHLAECRCITFQKEPDFTFSIDRFLEVVNQNHCRMVLFSNPCNPTSLGLKREDVLRIVTGTDALVVVDEAYMDFWDQSILQQADQYDNLIVLRTCSKMLGLAAVRLGFAVANQTLTRVLRAAKSPYNVSALAQAAGAAVFAQPELIQSARRRLLASRNELYLFLKNLSDAKGLTVYETCTNFVTVKYRDCDRVFEELKKHSIVIRNFKEFLRISCGNEQEHQKLFHALLSIL